MRNNSTPLADVIELRQPESELTQDIGWLVGQYGYEAVLAEVEMHHPIITNGDQK